MNPLIRIVLVFALAFSQAAVQAASGPPRAKAERSSAARVKARTSGGDASGGRLRGNGRVAQVGGELQSGVPQAFVIPAVAADAVPSFVTGDSAFRITVPEGAGRLQVTVTVPNFTAVDIDLAVRSGEPPVVDGLDVIADARATSLFGVESVTITDENEVPLAPGVYYIAIDVWTPDTDIEGEITATFSEETFPGTDLVDGQVASYSLPGDGNTLFHGAWSYRIDVPADATELFVSSETVIPSALLNTDLFVRYEMDTDLDGGPSGVAADYSSVGLTGLETIVIDQNSNPPLQAGSYYISLLIEEDDPDAQFVDGILRAVITTPATKPLLTEAGVVSAADFQNGAVSPGEILTFFGERIGPRDLEALQLNEDGQVTTFLGGTRVLFNGIPSPMVYSFETQTSAIAPFTLVPGTNAEIVIEHDLRISDPVSLPVVAAKPAVFTVDQSGSGQGAILNQDFSVNGPGNPAAVGSVIQIYMTGGGQTDPPGQNGVLAPGAEPLPRLTTMPVRVRMAGQEADVVYAGAAPGLVWGVVQVNAVVTNVEPGDAVPLEVLLGEAATQAGLTFAVRAP